MLRCIMDNLGSNMPRKGKQLHPGRILREEYMEPLRLDTQNLAAALGVTAGRCFRTSPQFWLGLQTAYDLGMAEARYGAEIEAQVHALAN
jgi:plasmid maintenance system antidote protein VapI